LHHEQVPEVLLLQAAVLADENMSPVRDRPPTGSKHQVLLFSNRGQWYLWEAEYEFHLQPDLEGPDGVTTEEAVTSAIRTLTQSEVVAYILQSPRVLRDICGEFAACLRLAAKDAQRVADGLQKDGGELAAIGNHMTGE
jgi:hypothetical protein